MSGVLCGGRYETCAGDQCYFTLRSLLILCPSYLIFMIANGGLALPGGLFMPSIMVRLFLYTESRHDRHNTS